MQQDMQQRHSRVVYVGTISKRVPTTRGVVDQSDVSKVPSAGAHRVPRERVGGSTPSMTCPTQNDTLLVGDASEGKDDVNNEEGETDTSIRVKELLTGSQIPQFAIVRPREADNKMTQPSNKDLDVTGTDLAIAPDAWS